VTRQEYLEALEKALINSGVRDYAEIVLEYGRHFDIKYAHGYSEEETAVTLAPPDVIASQYSDIGHIGRSPAWVARRVGVIAGAVALDVIVLPFFLVLFAWVAAVGAIALGSAASGFFCVAGIGSYSIGATQVVYIPEMPYISLLLAGFAFFSLAAFAAVSALFCCLYVFQISRKYLRWHKNAVGSGVRNTLPLPLKPWISPGMRKAMSAIVLVSAVIFGVAVVSCFVSMVIAARSMTPWVVWGW